MHSNNFQLEVWREFGNSEDIEFYIYFNGVRFYGWAFTLKGVEAVMKKDKITDESAGGRYFWAENFIIIDVITEDCLKAVISDLIRSDPEVLGTIFSIV